MASFSSSVINKSGKKFAPKAPIRRAGAARSTATPSATSSARASIERQTPATTPQPPQQAHSTAAEPAAAVQPDSIAEEVQHETPPAVTTTSTKPSKFPFPQPRRRPSFTAPSTTTTPTIRTETPTTDARPEAPASEPQIVSQQNAPTPVAETAQIIPETARHAESSGTNQVEDTTDTRPTKRPRLSGDSNRGASLGGAEQSPTPIPTPTSRPQSRASAKQPESSSTASKQATAKKTPRQTKKRKPRSEGIAEADGDDTSRPKRARRKREPTPEDAETTEITPETMKMSDLCRDLRTGRKSKREMELRDMDRENEERKRKERADRRESEQKADKESAAGTPVAEKTEKAAPPATPVGGPQMRIVNGEIVLDTSSLQIDRHADAARNAGDLEEVVENPLTRRINQASFGKRLKAESWDEDSTDLFYKGLRMFGTDFMMISKMFPGLTRRHIKLKFSNEERKDPERIKETLLGPRETVNMESFAEMTNTTYDDPRIIERELEEEKQRIYDEHAKEKEARELSLKNADTRSDSNVLPSIENGDGSLRSRFQQKKRQGKVSGFSGGGGTEEILGTIDDIPVQA